MRTLMMFAGMLVVGLFVLMAFTINAAADVNVADATVTPLTRAVKPGQQGSYSVSLNIDHTSGTADIYANLTNGTGGWMAWISPTGQTKAWYGITSDRTLTLTCYVKVPDDADVDDDPFTATLVVESTLGTGATLNWDTSVKQTFDIDLTTTISSKTGDRGEQVPFTFTLVNDGNGADTVSLSYDYTATEITVNGPASRTLQKFTSTAFTMYVDISDLAEAKTYHIDVVARSEDDQTEASVPIDVTVNPEYTYTLVVADAALNATPNVYVTYDMTFTNDGNVEVDFTVTALEVIAPWTYTINPTSFTLGQGEEQALTVKVKPDSDALAFATKALTIVVVPEVGKGSNTTRQVTTEVKQIYDVHLEGSSPSGKIMPGEWGEATITVVNDGNGEDTFNLVALVPAGWSFQFVPTSTITIDGNAEDTLTLRVYVAEDALYGPANVYANATSNEKPDVVSLDLALTVDVDQKYGVIIESPGETNREVDVQNQAKVIEFNFTVTNDGNK